jgi:hypothetical protein
LEGLIPSSKFQKIYGGYYIDFECIIEASKMVFTEKSYVLLDFGVNGKIKEHTMRFWRAFIRGFNVILVFMNIHTGKIMTRSHRIDNDIVPCDWVLVDFFITKARKFYFQTIKKY